MKLPLRKHHSSTSILVMCFPGTTIRPMKRLVMSIRTRSVSVDAALAATTAEGAGGRYSYACERMMLHSWSSILA